MVNGAMHGVAVRVVLLLCFRSSAAVNSGRVRVGMSTLALFVVDPGAVLCASLSMRGLDTSVMMERTCAIWLALAEACHLWRLAPGIVVRKSLRRRLPLLVLPHVGLWRPTGSCTCSTLVAHESSLQG